MIHQRNKSPNVELLVRGQYTTSALSVFSWQPQEVDGLPSSAASLPRVPVLMKLTGSRYTSEWDHSAARQWQWTGAHQKWHWRVSSTMRSKEVASLVQRRRKT